MKLLYRLILSLSICTCLYANAFAQIHSWKEAELAQQKYHQQLDSFRNYFGNVICHQPYVSFFLFGMGNRTKMIYKNGVLFNAISGDTIRQWKVKKERILPHLYAVCLVTENNHFIMIKENEKGIFINDNKAISQLPNTSERLALPLFQSYQFPFVLRELHHEILINIKDGEPLPNFFVYHKPWRRDGAMMAMCLQATGNVSLLRNWVLNLSSPYDYNNGGEAEADNLGQTLYLLSLFTDSTHPLVKQIIAETKKYEVDSNGIRYIKGRSDFHEAPVYQTKFLKWGLQALHMHNNYTVPQLQDDYSALFWWAYQDTYLQGTKDAGFQQKESNYYPYIDWAVAHFHHVKNCPVSDQDYPLSWETQASQANYKGMKKIDESYVSTKTSAPHTWHAAEMFLYLLELKK